MYVAKLSTSLLSYMLYTTLTLSLSVYSNGSVKVIFRVIVKVLKPSKETNDVVAVKIGRKINKQLKTGRIGNIQVVPEAIKLRGNIM